MPKPPSENSYSSSGSGSTARRTTGFLNPVTAVRDMKCITVSMSELHTLSVCNGLTSLFFGLGTTCFGFSIGIYTSYVNSDPKQITAAGILLHNTGERLCFWGGLVFVVAAVISLIFAHSTLNLIKGEMRK